MSVIINDFEVVVEKPSAPADAPKTADQNSPSAPTLTPQDIRQIVRHQAARMARIRAH